MTHAQIIAARDYLAECIAAGQEALLPVFERLDREVAAIESRESALDRARRLAAAKRAA